jgi:hypothetical protein
MYTCGCTCMYAHTHTHMYIYIGRRLQACLLGKYLLLVSKQTYYSVKRDLLHVPYRSTATSTSARRACGMYVSSSSYDMHVSSSLYDIGRRLQARLLGEHADQGGGRREDQDQGGEGGQTQTRGRGGGSEKGVLRKEEEREREGRRAGGEKEKGGHGRTLKGGGRDDRREGVRLLQVQGLGFRV